MIENPDEIRSLQKEFHELDVTLLKIMGNLSGIAHPLASSAVQDLSSIAKKLQLLETGVSGHLYTGQRQLTALVGVGHAINSSMGLEAVLEQVDLYGYEDVLTRNLSAGQQRRLALARLLVVDAPLWILDEPFTSLDVHGIGLIEDLLEAHTRNGGMLAMTSHHTVNLVNTPVHPINLSS